jgi:hypothetical protein
VPRPGRHETEQEAWGYPAEGVEGHDKSEDRHRTSGRRGSEPLDRGEEERKKISVLA